MKKLLLVLLVTGCGCLMAMDEAGAGTGQLPASDIRVTTLDAIGTLQEVHFTQAQMAKIGLLRGMLEEPLVAKSENINLSKSCVDAPYLRYGVLQHIPTLVGFEKRVDLEQYLDRFMPEFIITIMQALRFLDASPTFKWVHAYLIKQLISKSAFFKWSLVDIENLKMAMRFAWTDRLTESLNLFKIMRLKNGLVTTRNFPGGRPTLSNDGSLLAIQSERGPRIEDSATVTLYRTSNGNRVGKEIIHGYNPQFTANGKLVAVERFTFLELKRGGLEVELYHTHDFADPIASFKGYDYNTVRVKFSPNKLLMAVIREKYGNALGTVSLYRTNDLTHTATVTGTDATFSTLSQFLAVKIDDDRIAMYHTNDLTQAIATINGQQCAFNPDESLVAVEQANHVSIYPTSDFRHNIATIEGRMPFFSPDGTILHIRQYPEHEPFREDASLTKLYRISDWNHPLVTLRFTQLKFSPDGSLLSDNLWLYDCLQLFDDIVAGNGIDSGDDSRLIARNLSQNRYFSRVQFGSDDFDIAIAYNRRLLDDPVRTVVFERTLTMTIDEYLLVFAAIHQRDTIDEAFWRPMFDAAQPQVQKIVREKTDKFILPFWQRYTGVLAAHLHWPFSKS